MQRVFLFVEGEPSKELLGGKGANLAEMTKIGLPIPPGFTITTKTCIEYLNSGGYYPDEMWDEVLLKLKDIEERTEKKFGDPENPLLLSVRSGAKFSMPGMMDTILDLGMNSEIVDSLGKITENPRWVKDSYRRFIQMFSNVVHNLEMDPFERALEAIKIKNNLEFDHQLEESHLDNLISDYLAIFENQKGEPFPSDPTDQLRQSIKAVFDSWNNQRAINYRNHEGIAHDLGTAVNIQTMVFGNYDDDSGTGVLFSRNPATGEKKVFGEFLVNAQGEDVVAGIRTPMDIDQLRTQFPDIKDELFEITAKLETHFREMQDIEFTIERGKLYILQTRNGKRTGVAAAKIAYDMVQEGLIDKKEAIMRLSPRDVDESLFPSVLWENPAKYRYYDIENFETRNKTEEVNQMIDDAEICPANMIGEGLPAGPGAASGHIVFSSDLADKILKGEEEPPFEVKLWRNNGDRKVPRMILVKKETSPEDFHGMVASVGILTMRGGMTSHAALVGRQIGKRVIVGASSSGLELRGNTFVTKDNVTYRQGEILSIEIYDKGLVFDGALPIVTPHELPDNLQHILDWADEISELKVRTNADKRNDTQVAIDFKATGTGLARTEHQFFDALDLMRKMIMADTEKQRKQHLERMVELQKKDFTDLFETANGRPVTIRLLDPPLHEFLPNELELREKIWREHLHPDSHESQVLRKVMYYAEANPMLGLRGCRLGLLFPEITEMQATAIIEAALELKEKGLEVEPEIMIPLVGFKTEFQQTRKIIDRTAQDIFHDKNQSIEYKVGTMIEIPRAALMASEIAAGEFGADFFSFGTNDLHQMTLGFSRDDVAKFLPFYMETGVLDADPFQTIEQEGIGRLMDICVEDGRKAAKEAGKYLKVGICGEQGGDPDSIDFCYKIGLDYVSCSPYRVPVARLAAAQATLKFGEVDPKYGKVI